MTTIAYDGKHLAADTAHWTGDVLGWLQDKLHVIKDANGKPMAAYSWAGGYTSGLPLAEWIPKLLEGEKLPPWDGAEELYWHAIVIDLRPSEELRTYTLSVDMILAPCGVPIAIGSGADTALAAMRCNKTAIQAVQLCVDTTAYTAGPVTAYNVRRKRYEMEL